MSERERLDRKKERVCEQLGVEDKASVCVREGEMERGGREHERGR